MEAEEGRDLNNHSDEDLPTEVVDEAKFGRAHQSSIINNEATHAETGQSPSRLRPHFEYPALWLIDSSAVGGDKPFPAVSYVPCTDHTGGPPQGSSTRSGVPESIAEFRVPQFGAFCQFVLR
jgi:hypothetical protein